MEQMPPAGQPERRREEKIPFDPAEYDLDPERDSELLGLAEGDFDLLVQEMSLKEVWRRQEEGEISFDGYLGFATDIHKRINNRRTRLGLPPRPTADERYRP